MSTYTKSSVTLCSPDGSDLYSTTPSTSTRTPTPPYVSYAATTPRLSRRVSHNPPSETDRFHAITYLNQSTVSSKPLCSFSAWGGSLPRPDIEAYREQRRNARRSLERGIGMEQFKPKRLPFLQFGRHSCKNDENKA